LDVVFQGATERDKSAMKAGMAEPNGLMWGTLTFPLAWLCLGLGGIPSARKVLRLAAERSRSRQRGADHHQPERRAQAGGARSWVCSGVSSFAFFFR